MPQKNSFLGGFRFFGYDSGLRHFRTTVYTGPTKNEIVKRTINSLNEREN